MSLPSAPTSLSKTIPQYLYVQYKDDDNLQAFVSSYNQLAQEYVDWFNNINLPVYTGQLINGELLDWVAQGLYDISRPIFNQTASRSYGPFNTYVIDGLAFNARKTVTTGTYQVVDDDIFKRVLTWNLYKGDGPYFSMKWVKNRVKRFLTGVNGTGIPTGTSLYDISAVVSGATVTITIPASYGMNITYMAQAFASGALVLPPQYTFTIQTTYLTNDGNVLALLPGGAAFPTTPGAAGSIWNNGGVLCVVSGVTPSPTAAPVYFGPTTDAELLSLGGGNLPLTNPGKTILWNNGGLISIGA